MALNNRDDDTERILYLETQNQALSVALKSCRRKMCDLQYEHSVTNELWHRGDAKWRRQFEAVQKLYHQLNDDIARIKSTDKWRQMIDIHNHFVTEMDALCAQNHLLHAMNGLESDDQQQHNHNNIQHNIRKIAQKKNDKKRKHKANRSELLNDPAIRKMAPY